MKTKVLVTVAAAALVAATVFLTARGRPAPADAVPASAANAPAFASLPPPREVPAPAQPVALSAADADFLKHLREKFVPRLGDKHARIKALEQVVAYLREHYPADWQQRVRAFLDALAPELAAELLSMFQGLMRLNEWLAINREALSRLPPDERRAALWAARREAFGADAEAIYAGEVRAEGLLAALKDLDVATGLTTDEKLARFVAAVNETWGEQAPDLLQARGTELMNRFLDVPSVQEDLRGQTAAERGDTLRRIRAGMGLDAAALERWDALDQQRDQAWATGQDYWVQRQALAARYDGAELQARLGELQDRLFGDEAQAIRDEEAAGFYRYDRPRRYGRE